MGVGGAGRPSEVPGLLHEAVPQPLVQPGPLGYTPHPYFHLRPLSGAPALPGVPREGLPVV